jgi:hypothetical protein
MAGDCVVERRNGLLLAITNGGERVVEQLGRKE